MRAQLRAETDTYVAHLYRLTRPELEFVLESFTGVRKKETKVFGEFMSKRKCLEEYDRIGTVLA